MISKNEIEFEKLQNVNGHYIRLFKLLKELDKHYIPNISETVNIEKYAKKLINKAINYSVVYMANDIGIISLYADDIDNKVAFLTSFGILPHFHSKGIASLMMEKAIDICRKNKMKSFLLEVGKDNVKAITFYKKNGFLIISEDSLDTRYIRMKKHIND